MEDKTRHQIYKYRCKLGLSMKELADKVGVSESTISFWESGTTSPRMAKAQKLAEIFGIDVSISPRMAKAQKLAEIFGIDVSILVFGEEVFDDHDGEDVKILNAIKSNKELKEVVKILIDLAPNDLERVLNVIKACQNRR